MLTKPSASETLTPVVSGSGARLARWQPGLLALLGAGLLWLGWPVHPAPLAALLLIGWVPYLRLEQLLTQRGASGWQVFRYTYLLLLLWNAFTTWWVSFSTLGGGIAAVVLNALLMCLPTMAFYHTKRLAGPTLGYISLPIYWIAFEQLHLHWDLTWPWLTLGNGFAQANQWVQWYEYTGFLGGSLWMWMVNILAFLSMRNSSMRNEELRMRNGGQTAGVKPSFFIPHSSFLNKFLLAALAAAVLPMGFSYWLGATYQEKGRTAEVVVVQPNVDPFLEKFSSNPHFIPYDEQLSRLLRLTEQQLTPRTRLVLWPETALEESYFEQNFETNPKVARLRSWLALHPGVELITGITSIKTYASKEAATPTARFRDDLGYYDVFNTAVHFPGASGPVTFYHKSRLVPGVEKVPVALTKLVANIDLGGIVGSYGSQADRTVFRTADPALRLAPSICYESVYGDFMAEYVKNGATLIGIITNDGWWSDSPGHRQHIQYATLRAIETRRDIARSANTGISAFINQKGEILTRTAWWVQDVRRHTVHLNEELTFYVRHGELLGPVCQVLAVLLLGFVGTRRLRK